MTRNFIYLVFISCLISNAYADTLGRQLFVSAESMEGGGSATSIGVTSDPSKIFYVGGSLNYITSSSVIQRLERKTILPAYIFLGFKAPWKVSPYIELGGDLSEALIDDLLSSGNETNTVNENDYYYSGGIKLALSESNTLSFYAKKYKFIYRSNSILYRVSPTSYGVSLSIAY